MSKRISMLLATAALLGFNQQIQAAGFGLIEQSVSSMGNAYAGGAAIAEDASTIFFNPAGLTRLCGNQVTVGAHGIFPSAEFDDDGSIITHLVGAGPVQPTNFTSPFPLTGGDGGDAGMNALVGNFYYSRQINHCWWLGLAITSPFGLSTSYDDNWKGRYQALHSSLLTIDINPVFAYKINQCWSVGGGFRALYAHAKLTSAVDYGSIAWVSTLPLGETAEVVETGLNQVAFLPQTQDGHVKIKGNAWGYGGNFGVLYEPCCGTRLGFNWRSQIHLKIKGTEDFDNLPALIANPSLVEPLTAFFTAIAESAATDTRAKTSLTLPDIFQVSAYHELNNCWAVMADITWTRWDVLNKLTFQFDNPNQDDSILTFKWKNAFRYSVGTSYKPNCDWTLRAGVAYDMTPVRNKELISPRLPDNDRLWAACGFGYDWSECLHFDVGYAHLFIQDPKIDKTEFELSEDLFKGGVKGKWKEHTDIASVQVVWNF